MNEHIDRVVQAEPASGSPAVGRRRHRVGLVALVVLALVGAACGADDGSASPTDGDTTAPTDTTADTTAPADTTPDAAAPDTAASADTTLDTATPADTTAAPAGAAACAAEVDMKAPGSLTVRSWADHSADELPSDLDTGVWGLEGAVLYAVAEELGFSAADVVFEVIPATGTESDFIIAGDTSFDIAISIISITEARAETVDFSDSYYDVEQSLVGRRDSVVASATSVAELSDASLGVFFETASVAFGSASEYVEAVIAPAAEPIVYPILWEDTAATQAALDDGTIDALVVDLPSAEFLLSEGGSGMQNAAVVAVLPRPDEPFEQFGMVLQKGNPLVACVNMALASLREAGTLAALESQWLHDGGTIPILAR